MFLQEVERIVKTYTPQDLVQMYEPLAESNRRTLIRLSNDFPKYYFSWKKMLIKKYNESANLFIKTIEMKPRIRFSNKY